MVWCPVSDVYEEQNENKSRILSNIITYIPVSIPRIKVLEWYILFLQKDISANALPAIQQSYCSAEIEMLVEGFTIILPRKAKTRL